MMTSSSPPFVSIVIPVLDRAGDLALCLDSLAQQDYPADLMEIIVVDNGSADDSAEVARKKGALVLEESEKGAAHARNRGVRMARGRLIAFVDSDCRAEPQWLRRMVAAFEEDDHIGFCGGKINPECQRTALDRYIADRKIMDQEQCCQRTSFSFPFVMTANAMFSRQALEKAGLFDTSLKTGEDADLCWRVAWSGYQWRYVPEAQVRHRHRSDLRSFATQVFGYGLGTVCLYKKHFYRFGSRWRMDCRRYRMALWTVLRLPVAMVARRGDERRWLFYEMVDYWAFAAGRVYGAVTRRKLFL